MRFFNNRWMVFGGVTVVVLALGVLGTSIAVADEDAGPAVVAGDQDDVKKARRGQRHDRGRGKGLRQLSKAAAQLDLSAEQQALLDAVVAGEKEQREVRRASRGAADKAGSFGDGAIDADAVHARIDDRFDASRAAAHRKADNLIAFYTSLDPGQRAELESLMDQARERRSERRGQRGPEAHKGQRGAGFDGDRPARQGRGGFGRSAQGS